jgi:NAD(P)-dependent dehydrogenase (short-subunit alcohol dehydrogenase family)
VSVFLLTQAFVPVMRDGKGSIVNVSSIGPSSSSRTSPHCASKAGLSMFTKATAVDLPDLTTTRVRPFRLRWRLGWSIIWARRRETSAASYDKRP